MGQSSADTHMTNNDAAPELLDTADDDTNTDSLRQVESMLDYIRGNLDNIRRTWGVTSSQYHAASEIMQKHFDENIKKLNLSEGQQQASLDDLIAKLSLDENDAPKLR